MLTSEPSPGCSPSLHKGSKEETPAGQAVPLNELLGLRPGNLGLGDHFCGAQIRNQFLGNDPS